MVLPEDKGRPIVVMDTETNHTKMSTLIENGPYQLLNNDPTDCLNWKVSEKLLTLKRSGIYPRPFTTTSDLDTNSCLESTVYQRFTRLMYS